MSWDTFLSTLFLVFVAELGDKTQLAVITQTCKYRRGLPVFLGASTALTGVTALGVGGGQALSSVIPQDVIRAIAAGLFVVMGILLWRESIQCEDGATMEERCADAPLPKGRRALWHGKAFVSTLGLLFFAELGDKTQLAVMGLASKRPAPWAVFAGGALALTGITALGVVVGRQMRRWIPERLLLKLSAASFIVMGVLMGLNVV
ncbi:MAG: TMEM165/GDT1 family protein [Anaerolineae bacterium]